MAAYSQASAPPPYSEVLTSTNPTSFTSSIPATQVELHVSCRNLADLDVFSKSDPMVVMFVQALGTKEWREHGRTEVIMNNLNPDFVKKFTINYFFEEVQKLKFQVYDIDKKSARLQDHVSDYIYKECHDFDNYHILLINHYKVYKESLLINIICDDVVFFQFRGHKLDKIFFFGKSDPFLVFFFSNEDNSFTAFFFTEVIKNTLNFFLKEFSIPSRAFFFGDYDRLIRVECYDWDFFLGHDLIGIFSTTLRELTTNTNITFELIHPGKKAKKKSYKNSGTISILHSKIEQQPTFLDYIRGGVQINFIVAIDFTASNGDPRNSNSLHYLNPYEPNLYVKALTSVGAICEDYDTDKMFPALGFGARIPPNWTISHEFPLNGLPQNPFCDRVEGVIAAYFQSIQSVQLYGPTNFAPVIRKTVGIAKHSEHQKPGQEYFVLLILTDGIISDMEQTKAAIVEAASLPVSIIIVGIGPAEFDAMEELDGDTVRLSSRGRYAERDIVQFVPFRDYLGKGSTGNVLSGARLAKDVLEELPDQFLEYMKKRGFKPHQPQ
ncbi:copine-5 [Exaiptasia diaphana]|uniref:Copine-3 n=1 Tax=Exaiptasia diaphana TaxID=2652724 RepID=A0A913X2T8_EXADI|nr:copine-5 [Exaiptasia diaphana]